MSESDKTAMKINENRFRKVVFVTLFLVICEITSEILTEISTKGQHQVLVKNLYVFDDTKYTVVYVFLRILSVWCAFSHEYVNILILFSYLNICMHVKTLYEQLKIKLQRFNDVKNNDIKMAHEILKDCVETHKIILEICRQIQDNFSLILSNTLVTNVIATSLGLLFVATTGSFLMFINVGPAILFNLGILCYPSWLISNEVNFHCS